MDNTTDAISRIQDWSKTDQDRLGSVEDSKDIDDDSIEINKTEIINRSDLDNVILEVSSLKTSDRVSINSAILGSWHSTPRPIELSTLLTMYGNGGWDSDNHAFTKSINLLALEQNQLYSSKIDVANDLDNIFSDQHEICSGNNLGHGSDIELGYTDKERAAKECYVINSNKREYYSLSWEEIEEATDDDEFLVQL